MALTLTPASLMSWPFSTWQHLSQGWRSRGKLFLPTTGLGPGHPRADQHLSMDRAGVSANEADPVPYLPSTGFCLGNGLDLDTASRPPVSWQQRERPAEHDHLAGVGGGAGD